LPVVVAGLTAFGVLMSFGTGDPHWLSRAGALIAAVAAGAIIVQIVIEIHLEGKRSALEDRVHNLQDEAQATPLDDLASRLSAKRLEVHSGRLSRERLIVAAYVVGAAMVGEVLHGFGDLWMCAWLLCQAHS